MSEPSEVLVSESEVPLDGSDTSNDELAITTPFDTSKIRVETKNTQMDTLIKRIKNAEIDLAPSFQRRAGIWNDQAQSRLIESMLIKIPLPAFYMDATVDDKWVVVDGLQRLTAIRRYVTDEELSLTGMEFLTDYNNIKFSKLPRGFRRRIEETDIVLYLIQPGTPSNVKFDIFRRINTGGEPLSAQEIRHALNQGPVTAYLEKLAKSTPFLHATNNGISSKRMDDRECVLRFLAFTLTSPEDYRSDNLDQYLHSIMSQFNKFDRQELDDYEKRFTSAMWLASKIFERHAFRKCYNKDKARHPINKALFEVVSVAFGKLNEEEASRILSQKDAVLDGTIQLFNEDKEFETAISQGTGSIKRVIYRFCRFENMIRTLLK